MQTIPSEILFRILKKVEKPARYWGGEINAIVKNLDQIDLKIALVMPETYEIGESNLGIKILYEILNKIPNVAAERVYAPWLDFEQVLRSEGLPPFSLENKVPLNGFDIIGFSLPYELSYTNILTLLDLSKIPFRSKDRPIGFPILIGGGNQAFNPEPIADFFDAFVVGDGEEAVVLLAQKMLEFIGESRKKTAAFRKEDLLKSFSKIDGVYVPSFFEVRYRADQTLEQILPLDPDYQGVKKATVKDLDQAVFPERPIVPSVKTVHDRLAVEVQRGCVRGCRFCQAGYIYRPERQRSPENVLNIIEKSIPNTGNEEVSLLSLSIGDYDCLVPLVRTLFDRYEKQKISVSLPATRTDTFSSEILEQIKRVRRTGFTVAPEAGTPRMRRVINKGNSREDLFATVEKIFEEGWQLVKFYYMCGLPFETDEDLLGIVEEAEAALKIGRRYSSKAKIHLSVSPHVPKPHTPFQWEAQDSVETTKKKIAKIRSNLKSRGIEFKWHKPEESYLEGVFARGDRRLSVVIEKAWELGCRFDGWEETFDFETWKKAFLDCQIDPDFYVARERTKEEILPWDHLFIDLKKEFLWDEKEAAKKEAFIEDCSTHRCFDCGICDFKQVQNINFKLLEKTEPLDSDPSLHLVKFSTRARKLISQKAPEFLGASTKNSQSQISSPKNYEINTPNQTSIKTSFIYRARFTKLGPASFLSHLELMNVLRRAFSRAEIPLCFSEGFHPQPKISFSQALPVGVKSYAEFLDFEVRSILNLEEVLERLNARLPEGLNFVSVVQIDRTEVSLNPKSFVMSWRIDLSQSYPSGREGLEDRLRWIRSQSELKIIRKKEKKTQTIDLAPMIRSVDSSSETSILLQSCVVNDVSMRPQELLFHLFEDPGTWIENALITKIDAFLI